MTTPPTTAWRISLPTLFVLTTFVAVAVGATRNANQWWLLAISTASLLIFLTAAVIAVIDRGERQAFAIGFLLCGALHWAAWGRVDDLPSKRLFEGIYDHLVSPQMEIGRAAAQGGGGAPARTTPQVSLAHGDTGAPVRALQAALNSQALFTQPPVVYGKVDDLRTAILAQTRVTLPLEVDGDFGPRTKRAVIAFQNRQGLTADGVVTLETWRALGPAATQALELNGISRFLTATPAEVFLAIGGWLITLLVAFLGGHVAAATYMRRHPATAESATP